VTEQGIVQLISAVVPYVFLFLLGVVFRGTIRDKILPNVASIEGFGLKIGLVAKKLDEAVEERRGDSGVSPHAQPAPGERQLVLRRAQRLARLLQGARLLWIDQDPAGNHYEIELLRSLGIGIDLARSGEEAAELLRSLRYEVVVSNIKRVDIVNGTTFTDGVKFLAALSKDFRGEGKQLPPVAFYVMTVDPVIDTSLALGVTNRPDQLLHYVFDAVERTRS